MDQLCFLVKTFVSLSLSIYIYIYMFLYNMCHLDFFPSIFLDYRILAKYAEQIIDRHVWPYFPKLSEKNVLSGCFSFLSII